MERRSFIRKASAGAATGGVILGAPEIVAAQPTVRWRMPSSFAKSLDTLFGVSDVVAKRVASLTDGKFQISTHAPGEIVPALQVLDAVQNGTVEIGHTALYYYFGKEGRLVDGPTADALPEMAAMHDAFELIGELDAAATAERSLLQFLTERGVGSRVLDMANALPSAIEACQLKRQIWPNSLSAKPTARLSKKAPISVSTTCPSPRPNTSLRMRMSLGMLNSSPMTNIKNTTPNSAKCSTATDSLASANALGPITTPANK
jgi:hypothetical protein